jgi:hypothetical protein
VFIYASGPLKGASSSKRIKKNPVLTQNPESMFLTSPPLVKETDMVCNRQKQRRLPYSLATSQKHTLAVQSPGINSQPGGPARQPYLTYWPARPQSHYLSTPCLMHVCDQPFGKNRYSTTHALLLHGGLFMYPLKFKFFPNKTF